MTPQYVHESPEAKQLDEAVWQAWLAKGRNADERGRNFRLKAMTVGAIAALLCAAALWSRAEPFEVIVRFLVMAGAIAVMLQAITTRRYLFVALFAALAVLFNPVVPLVPLSGDWQRALLVASAAPFVASLAWRAKAVA